MPYRRRKLIETVSVDSLEEGDAIHQHRDGLSFGTDVPQYMWAIVNEITRDQHGDLSISYMLMDKTTGVVTCYPEMLVKRRTDQEQ
jgi:hypothetical protein